MSWSSRRRFIYALVVLGGGALVLGLFLFTFYNQPPTCFDGRKNGDELGVDCGGACNQICLAEVAPLVIQWSRAFRVSSGNYNVVAYVENPNNSAGIRAISYRFDLFDENNVPVANREGKTFISPGGISPIFEANIETGASVPTRTFFEFTEEPRWYKASDTRDRLSIQGKELLQTETRPRINAILKNSSAVDEFNDIDVTAIVFGTDGNAIAASRTIVPFLSPRESQSLVFTWPEPFAKNVERCIRPADTMLLFDVSGSMNDDGDDPQQPIEDAKAAALSFGDRLSSDDRIGLVSFATNAELNHVLSLEHKNVGDSLRALTVLPEEEVGSTNIGAALEVAFEELFNINQDRGSVTNFRRVILLLTDGKANAPEDPGGEVFAMSKAREAKATGITIYTIGLGDLVNTDFLRDIASLPENYHQATSAQELNQIYRSISESICERGPAIIDIIPRTPSSLTLLEA